MSDVNVSKKYPCGTCRYYFKIFHKEQYVCLNTKCPLFATNPLYAIDPYDEIGYKECMQYAPRDIQPKEGK